MKVLGLLGGMSWESSINYEKLINEAVRDRLGGTNSADLVIRSFNFSDIEALQQEGKWLEAGQLLAKAAADLERSGAQAILLCTNTMHVLAEQIEREITIPLLHIADATGATVSAHGLNKVLLLGTKYTMEKDFYKGRLTERFGVEVAIPDESERAEVHRIIYEELVQGVIRDDSREFLKTLVQEHVPKGIEGVIAGCTEIELLLHPEDVSVSYFPTTALHVSAAIEFALTQ